MSPILNDVKKIKELAEKAGLKDIVKLAEKVEANTTEMTFPFSEIMGVNYAGKMWGYKPGYVKNLCREGYVEAIKIGKTWIIKKDQPKPNITQSPLAGIQVLRELEKEIAAEEDID